MARPTPQQQLEILERRTHVARRWMRGEPQHEIAQAFEVDRSTISHDLTAIRAEWLSRATGHYDKRQAEELARVDECERQAWAAWARSQEPAETLRARRAGGTETTEKVSKGQAGD